MFPVAKSLVNNNPNLHHLEIKDTCSASLIYIAKKCPQLTHIAIGHWSYVSEDSITKLVSSCPKLKYAKFEENNFNDTALGMMSRTCPDLEYLEIIGCPNISKEALWRFANPATAVNLRHLCLGKCYISKCSYSCSSRLLDRIKQNLPNVKISIDERSTRSLIPIRCNCNFI